MALDDEDSRFMDAAIALARRGLGTCAPNPAVGALIVRDGVILARGWTQPGGRPHAETEALRALEAAGRRDDAQDATLQNATLYVTLEPCSHHGRTPPCAEAVAKAGFGRVVSALEDPDPRVAGRGHAMLRAAGIEVRAGVRREAALAANLGHVLRVTRRRPFVCVKLALTADGFSASAPGAPRLMATGEAAARAVHMWRAQHDAILIGAGTARTDDPLLTVRLPGLSGRRPLRVVLDPRVTLSPASQLALGARTAPTLLIAAAGEPDAQGRAARDVLRGLGVDIAEAPSDTRGGLDLLAALELLAARGVTRLFCEAGPRLAEAFLAAGLADEVLLLRGPRRFGGPGIQGLAPERIKALHDASRYERVETRLIGDDALTRLHRID
ncbi:bifunctional diaminohydroxyphosphoribosylaminopyrimidine deaminase/5-amino-6-(5-phosphoribosylamino)uracil reductase RibD [Methylocella sp.]|uniref:bifunctional diaminohydroxyphosphoribosylaminopyrimidine deaminase/5-amino-6-(5-phosphoribosylamino)uracil reductase RibD n=1 Tax=Methylocella sp. TaxID=1978226 RepID=UPI0037846809